MDRRRAGAPGQGVGEALLAHAELRAVTAGARLLIVETSALPALARARRFYGKHGYEERATGFVRGQRARVMG